MAHPRGRQPIAVNQPPSGGTNYPFVFPSDDIKNLLGDFYLSYWDRLCELVFPFHIVWMYGFGSNVVAAPGGWPTPTHDYDIIIHDDNGTVVFDSTAMEDFKETDWPSTNPRLKILEWSDEGAIEVCRLTFHTEWAQEDIDGGLSRDYDLYIEPENGELDARTLHRVPDRVNALKVGLVRLTGRIIFDSGYNVAWTTGADSEYGDFDIDIDDLGVVDVSNVVTEVTGERRSTKITIDAIPGSGLGVVPGCEETEPVVRKIAGAVADEGGNIIFDTGQDKNKCIQQQRPVGLVESSPREFKYLSDTLTPEESRSAIELNSNCGPCCECDYFVRTYKGLKRQWNLWQSLTERTELVRDLHSNNIDRWNREKDCREKNPLRIIIVPQYECKVAVGALHCNTSPDCIVPMHIRFTFSAYGEIAESVLQDGFTCHSAEVDGSEQKHKDMPMGHGEPYALAGSYPVYEAQVDYADPQDSTRVSFMLCVPDCQPGDSIKMWVSVHFPETENGPPEAAVPEDLEAIWEDSALGQPTYPARAIKESKNVTLDRQSAYCATCSCSHDEAVDESESESDSV